MKHLLTAIVSGGASGAERGSLRAAVDLDLGYGGWSWPDDDVPDVYASRMRPAVSRAMQRRLNVQDSDATLFVMRHGSKEMKFIVDACRAMRKPAKTLVLSDGARIKPEVDAAFRDWISERRISVLNVVGDADEQDTRDALVWMLEERTAKRPVVEFDPTNGFHVAALAQVMADSTGQPMNGFDAAAAYASIAATAREPVNLSGVTLKSAEDGIADTFELTLAGLSGSSPSPDTCETCGAKSGECYPGNAGDVDTHSGACPDCGAWPMFTEGGTDA